jgi:hypothetical protein
MRHQKALGTEMHRGPYANVNRNMTHYKGRQSAKAVEKDFPHFVDMFVPDGGVGRRLDTMYEWHRARGIESHHGRGRRTDEGRYYVRWCFADAALARAFAGKFGT